jgi:hypothetical protein
MKSHKRNKTKHKHTNSKHVCKICNKIFMTGGCGCNNIPMGGGNNNNNNSGGASLLPGPDVGMPWGKIEYKWPGVDGISGNRNYLSSYADKVGNDPSLQAINDSGYTGKHFLNSIVGGKRKSYKNKSYKRKNSYKSKSKNRNKSGGGFLVNLGRDLTFNLNTAYNAINGYPAPVDPLPYKDQLKI